MLFFSVDKVSDNKILIKLELRWICSADTVTDVRCDENVLNLTVLGIFIRYMYVNAHLMSLILGGHARESMWLQTVLSFFMY